MEVVYYIFYLLCKIDGVSLLAIENSQASLSIMIFVVRVGWRFIYIIPGVQL